LEKMDRMNKTIASGGDGLDNPGTLVGDGISAGILSEGSVFAGRYKVVSDGKAGGMGVVYKCLDLKLGEEPTALKVIHPRLLSSEEALKRFHQEVTISRKLSHDGIVRVHDIGSHDGLEYFTMEWMEGVSLRDIIAERKKKHHPFSLEETYTIINALSEALQHAHRHTIHRDIKPENIMIQEGDASRLKLMDFGIAKMFSASQMATTSIQMGTPYYMAPEQKLDTGHVDKRADIYSVGVILFELLTLENTVGPELPSDLNPNLPKEIDDVFRKAVALKPEKRYGDIKELDAALLKIVRAEKERLQQAEEEAQRKREAELAEQKRREVAEAERRKKEEEQREAERKAKALREQQEKEERERQAEQERKRLEAEAQAEREKQAEMQRRQEEEAARRRQEEENRRKQNRNILLFAGIIVAMFIVIAYTVSQNRTATVQQTNNLSAPTAPVTSRPAERIKQKEMREAKRQLRVEAENMAKQYKEQVERVKRQAEEQQKAAEHKPKINDIDMSGL